MTICVLVCCTSRQVTPQWWACYQRHRALRIMELCRNGNCGVWRPDGERPTRTPKASGGERSIHRLAFRSRTRTTDTPAPARTRLRSPPTAAVPLAQPSRPLHLWQHLHPGPKGCVRTDQLGKSGNEASAQLVKRRRVTSSDLASDQHPMTAGVVRPAS
jgi:hypothetical protein